MTVLPVGVLISGSGSNLEAINNACNYGILQGVAKVNVVISNKQGVFGLERAEKAGIPNFCIKHGHYRNRESFDSAVVDVLRNFGVKLVVLAGFMRIVTPVLLDAFPGSVMNLHPALLPLFPGTTAAQDAIDAGMKVSGCTVHFVDAGVDTGQNIIQRAVPVYDTDTKETLMERIHPEEHLAYPEAIKLFAEKRLQIEGRRVIILPEE